jgi:hypothetical protein
MGKRTTKRAISLDKLDPFAMEGSREDIALIREGIAEIEKRHGLWTALLAEFERRAGISGAPIVPLSTMLAPVAKETVIRRRRLDPYPTEPIMPLQLVTGSTADVVYKILKNATRPISPAELRIEFAKTELGKNLEPHENPHYAGVQRLKIRGYCVSYKGRLITPDNLKKYLADVAAGRVEDVGELPRFHSKWQEAIGHYLHSRNGEWVKAREIAEHVGQLPDFADIKNVLEQVCTNLSTMLNRRKIVEKQGTKKEARWRLVRTSANGAHADEADNGMSEKMRAAEASPSAARH